VVLVGSLLAVAYVWKLVEVLYFQDGEAGTTEVKEAPLLLLIPTWALVVANVYFGINTDLTVGTAETAVKLLLGGGS